MEKVHAPGSEVTIFFCAAAGLGLQTAKTSPDRCSQRPDIMYFHQGIHVEGQRREQFHPDKGIPQTCKHTLTG